MSEKKSFKRFFTRSYYGQRWQEIKDWGWGTDDKPLPVFSKRARFKRWFLINFRGYVYYITTIYDKPTDEYLMDRTIIHKSELPREAVHVTNMKNTWHLDLDLPRRGFDSSRDNGFTSVDAFLYMKCNKIDEAMRIRLDGSTPIDTNKLLMIGAIVIGVLFAVYYLMM